VTTALEELATTASSCTRCALAEGRTQVVFGVGDPDADLLFVGEGPGAEEDRIGEPFVGRSGQLLDQLMVEELGITRREAYIANVVKCRPPDNRDPSPDEIAPRVVVTLGRFAGQLLLASKTPITKLRGRSYPFGGAVLIPTLHPAYALRGGRDALASMRADFALARQTLTDLPQAATGATAP
jgi:uracil-DNA glycosylase family 4